MKTITHTNNSRGEANFGWLHSRHTFSFGQYFNPERTHFGVLRVLNDDIVAGGRGFGTHPHANMEIVSIPLSGALEHRDSTGRHKVIHSEEVQIMSAGTGIRHSEYNASAEEPVSFLQVWVLPEKKDIEPRYDQKEFPKDERLNKLLNVVAPDNPDALWINQQAWFYLGNFEKGKEVNYLLNNRDNGIYLFVIEGEVQAGEHFLKKRDALGMSEVESLLIKATENTEYLLMEVSMKV